MAFLAPRFRLHGKLCCRRDAKRNHAGYRPPRGLVLANDTQCPSELVVENYEGTPIKVRQTAEKRRVVPKALGH